MSNSKLAAIINCKCPKCRTGNLFSHFAYHPTKFNRMYKFCPVCGESLKPEPGFYIGGMYISYGINTALMIAGFVAIRVLFPDAELWVYLTAALVPIFLFFPLNFRLSRSMMLHFFGWIKYDPEAARRRAN